MSTQPESKISRAIIAMIKANGGYAVKFHGGPMTEAGTPDILACIPVRCCEAPATIGLFVGIETKVPGKRDNVSAIQQRRHAHITHSAGVVIVPTSVSEARTMLEALGWVPQPAFSTVTTPTDD
jgi:hypothetical protein